MRDIGMSVAPSSGIRSTRCIITSMEHFPNGLYRRLTCSLDIACNCTYVFFFPSPSSQVDHHQRPLSP